MLFVVSPLSTIPFSTSPSGYTALSLSDVTLILFHSSAGVDFLIALRTSSVGQINTPPLCHCDMLF